MHRRQILRAGVSVALATTAIVPPSLAAPTDTVLLTGQARTGDDVRAARFAFLCTQNGANAVGVLSIRLIVPHAESLAATFAFDPFEGPDATAGRLTTLAVATAAGHFKAVFQAAGSYGTDPDQPFVFDVSAARHGDAKALAALTAPLRLLAAGPGQLRWRQAPAYPAAGVAIEAVLDVSAAAATQLRAALASCLAAR